MEKKHDFEGRFDKKYSHVKLIKFPARGWIDGDRVVKDFIRQELIAVLERAKEGSEVGYVTLDGFGRVGTRVVTVEFIDSLIDELK